MRTLSVLSTSLFLFAATVAPAKSLYVSQDPASGRTDIYRTVAAAMDAADDGDKIEIIYSPHFESGFTLTKPLYIQNGIDGIVEFGITSGSIQLNGWFDIRGIYFYQHTSEPGIIINNPYGSHKDYDPQINNCAVVSVSSSVADYGIIDAGVETSIVKSKIFYQNHGLLSYDPQSPYVTENNFYNLYGNIIWYHGSQDRSLNCRGNSFTTYDGYSGMNVQTVGTTRSVGCPMSFSFNQFYNPGVIGACIDFGGLAGEIYHYENTFHKCPSYAFLNNDNISIINESTNKYGDCRKN